MNKKIAGFVIIAAALLAMGVWELWGRENFSYKEILVVRGDLPANTVVEEKDIETKKSENPPQNALRAGEEKKIIGMETAQFVAEDSPLYMEYFRQSQFATGEETEKEILSVPADWLLSLPQTIRRGDKVTFYNDKIKVMTAVVAYAKDGSNQEVLSSDKDRLNGTSTVQHIEIVGHRNDLVELSRLAGEGKKFTLTYC